MIVVSVFLCVFYCSDLGIPYYGTQQMPTQAVFSSVTKLDSLSNQIKEGYLT